ncbi:MAG: CHASE2 domain-containing protein [Phycisphaerae bacterium]|nr:CHASE2 domain-containing protein [Phycisphaerae bacterium]
MLAVLTLVIDTLGGFTALERWTVDQRMTTLPRPFRPMTDRIVHVDIDDGAITRFGRWPWDRAMLADAIAELTHAGARTIALDLLLSEEQQYPRGTVPSIDHDRVFAETLAASSCVLPVVLYEDRVFDAAWRRDPGPRELARLLHVLTQDIQTADRVVARRAGLTEPRRRVFLESPLRYKRAAAWRALARVPSRVAPPSWEEYERQMTPHRTTLSGDYPERPVLQWAWRQHLAWTAVRPLLARTRHHAGTYQDIAPLPAYGMHADAIGFVNFEARAHEDGVLREIPIVRAAPNGDVLQFGLAAAARHLGLDDDDVRIEPDVAIIGDTRLPLRDGRLWIAWPSSQSRPRWAGLLNQSAANPDPAGHLSIRAVIEIAHARRTRRTLERNHAELTALVLDHANVSRDDTPLDDPHLLAEAADEVSFTLSEVGPADDRGPEPDTHDTTEPDPFLDHVHNCRLWADVAVALDEARTRITVAEQRLRHAVEDRLVFVGWTATGAAADSFPTALDPVTPGVVVHAAVADMAMTGRAVRFVSDLGAVWFTLLPALLCAVIAARFAALQSSGLCGVVVLAYAAAAGWLFAHVEIAIPVAAPLVASIGVWVGCTAVDAVLSQAARRRITHQFRARVSGQLVDFLVANPAAVTVDGVEREMTVLFGDLADFTAVSESLGGRHTVAMLNRYLGGLSDALIDHGAYVNKFLGDGLMAFWSAFEPDPEQATRACAAIVACRGVMQELNRESAARGLPSLGLRIGVTTGSVVVGDCGAPPRLHDYTVIGDAVNLAARLESANKQFGTSSLIDGRTRALLDPDVAMVRPVGRVCVVGQTAAVDVFEVVETDCPPAFIELSRRVVDALAAGRDADAREALASFEGRFGVTPWSTRTARALAEMEAAGADVGTLQLHVK